MGERRQDPVPHYGGGERYLRTYDLGIRVYEEEERRAAISASASSRHDYSPPRPRTRPLDQDTLALPALVHRTRRLPTIEPQVIRRNWQELSGEECDNDTDDGASWTDSDVSSCEPNDAEQDHEPGSSHNTSKRQRIDTSNSSSGSASVNSHRRKHSSREDRISREGSDTESEDNGHIPRRTSTVQERLDPQMPCFVSGCKGRDATLSHML